MSAVIGIVVVKILRAQRCLKPCQSALSEKAALDPEPVSKIRSSLDQIARKQKTDFLRSVFFLTRSQTLKASNRKP